MNKEEFEAAARKDREELFRLYAQQPAPPVTETTNVTLYPCISP